MSSVTIHRRWKPWAGTVEAIARTVEIAGDQVRTWLPPDAPERARKRVEEVGITVALRDGVTLRLDSADELRAAIDPRDLGSIEVVTADVGDFYLHGGVELRATRHSGLTVDIRADDRARAAGLTAELEDVLSPRARLALGPFTSGTAYWVAPLAFFVALFFSSLLVIVFASEAPPGFGGRRELGVTSRRGRSGGCAVQRRATSGST